MSHNARRSRNPRDVRNQPSDWSPTDENWLQETLDMESDWPDYDQANDRWLELDRIDNWRKESSDMRLDDFE